MDYKNFVFLIIGFTLIVSGSILIISSIVISFSVSNQQNEFFDEEQIILESLSVRMDDGMEIKGFLYVDEDLREKSDNSVPTILLIPGINGRKENHRFKAFNLVKLGYAVFVIENRGHGESGGISGFLGKEPQDTIQVIDYIEDNYDFADTEHLGLYAFSYGGGIGLVLQAIDERIYASVIYHPLSSLERVIDDIPFENFIGHTTSIEDFNEITDAFDVCTPENTENLLIIHGEKDTLIYLNDSENLYDKVKGTERDDVELEVRLGIDHGQNEVDRDSLKYAIAWFEHFFHDDSIDIINRGEEINKIELVELMWPENDFPDLLILLAAIVVFFGLSIVLLPRKVWPLYYKHYSNLAKIQRAYDLDEVEERYDFVQLFGKTAKYNKMILYRITLYMLPTIIGGLICYLFNPSILYGYFIGIPIATTIVMAFVPSSEHPQWKYEWKSEWDDWYKNHVKVILISTQTIAIPIAIYLLVFNLNAQLMRTSPIPYFKLTALVYLAIPTGLVFMDSMLIRGWKFKHTIALIVIRPFTLVIFHLFVPIPIFENYGGIYLFLSFFIVLGLASWGVINLFDFIARTYKSRVTAAMILFLPFIILFLHWFFRIV